MGKHSDYKAFDKDKWPNYYVSGSGLITFRKRINGRQFTISTGEESILKAKKVVDEKLINLLSANPNAEKRKRRGITNPLLSDLWSDLMAEKLPASEVSTGNGYTSSWKYGIEPFWGSKTVLDVNPTNVTKWENWYLKEHGERIFFNTRKHFVMLLRFLKKQGLIADVFEVRDLDEIIVKKTKKKKVGRVYDDDEIQALLKNAVNDRTKLGILIYRYMGPRKMEVLKSELSRWNTQKGIAEIWSYKNRKWREIPIPKVVMDALVPWIDKVKKTGSKFLFPADKNPKTHCSSQVFDKAWAKTKQLAKIRSWSDENGARIHDLRHTFATQTKTDGWHPLVACKVLDMSLKEYERTYVHITTNEIELLMRKSFEGSL